MLQLLAAEREARQVALEYVSVILFFLLRAKRACNARVRIPRPCFARYVGFPAYHVLLAYYFVIESALDFLETRYIFYLYANGAQRNIRIHAHRSLGIRIIHVQVLQYAGKFLQKFPRFLGAFEVRLRDDFNERSAGAVVIHKHVLRTCYATADVHKPCRILLYLYAFYLYFL